MEFKEIEAFYWTAVLRGFARAADHLDTSQPTISARIAALERRLGVALFDRSGRDARLTARGAEMLRWAERIRRITREAEAAVSDNFVTHGAIRIGASETIVHTLLPGFIKSLKTEFPNLNLELTVDTTPVLREALVARELDLGFMLGPVSEPAMLSRPLAIYSLGFFAAPSLALGGRQLGLADVAELPFITYPRHTRPTATLYNYLSAASDGPPRLIATPSLVTNVRLATIGVGIVVVPLVMIKDEVASGVLEKIDLGFELEPLRFTAAYSTVDGGPFAAIAANLAINLAQTIRDSDEIASCWA